MLQVLEIAAVRLLPQVALHQLMRISLPVLIYDNHRRGHIPPVSWKLVAAVATSISLARGSCAVIKPVFRTSSRT